MPWFKKKQPVERAASSPANQAGGIDVDAMKGAGDVEGLIAVVANKAAGVNARGAAIQALGEVGDPRAVEPLIQELESLTQTLSGMVWAAENEAHMRDTPAMLVSAGLAGEMAIRSAKALAALGDPRAVPAFTALLGDDRLRQAAESPRRSDVPSAELIGALRHQAAELRDIAQKTVGSGSA